MFRLRISAQGPSTRSNLYKNQPWIRIRDYRMEVCFVLKQCSGSAVKISLHPPCAVQLDALETSLRGDGGGPRPVQHEGDLTEVVAGSEVANLLAGPALNWGLCHHRIPRHDDVEVVPWLALPHHPVPVLEAGRLQRVRHSQPLPGVEVAQYGDAGQQLLVHLPLPDSGAHQYPAVGVPVYGPQPDPARRLHRGRPWRPVYEGKLTKTRAVTQRHYPRPAYENVHAALVQNVEVISFVSLLDDHLALLRLGWKHRIEDVAALPVIQMRKEDILRDRL